MTSRAPAGRVLAVPVSGTLAAVEAERPDGTVLRGARAAAEMLWLMGGAWRVPALAARLPGAEAAYRAVAALRPLLSRWVGD